MADTTLPTSASLVETHRRLRKQVPWLLGVGALLMALLAYLLGNLPTRTPLTGYHYRQVGVQPDSTWWILAYNKAGKAELLFTKDTAKGWQRHELGVDSSQARALALNWGGKALLVGDSGIVGTYDEQLQLLGSFYPFNKKFKGRWVAVDKTGKRAVAIGERNQMWQTGDGGNWTPLVLSVSDTLYPGRWSQQALFDDEGFAYLVSDDGYYFPYMEPDYKYMLIKNKYTFNPWKKSGAGRVLFSGFSKSDELRTIQSTGVYTKGDMQVKGEYDLTAYDIASARGIANKLNICYLPRKVPGKTEEYAVGLGISSGQVFPLEAKLFETFLGKKADATTTAKYTDVTDTSRLESPQTTVSARPSRERPLPGDQTRKLPQVSQPPGSLSSDQTLQKTKRARQVQSFSRNVRTPALREKRRADSLKSLGQ